MFSCRIVRYAGTSSYLLVSCQFLIVVLFLSFETCYLSVSCHSQITLILPVPYSLKFLLSFIIKICYSSVSCHQQDFVIISFPVPVRTLLSSRFLSSLCIFIFIYRHSTIMSVLNFPSSFLCFFCILSGIQGGSDKSGILKTVFQNHTAQLKII
jgi:hypothetical protein